MAGPRDRFVTGATTGPLVALTSLLVLFSVDVAVTDVLLLACVVWPTVAALGWALARGLARRDLARTDFAFAAGVLVGTALAAGFVVGSISGLAYVLSDPGPPSPA